MDERRTRHHRQGELGLITDVYAQLQALLGEDETIPEAVRHCAEQFAKLEIWTLFSRNDPVKSCQDAARRRNRLGHKGIPLWDELKSFFGEYYDAQGRRKVFLAHCRGDRELNLDKVRKALEFVGEIRRVNVDVESLSGVEYGTVNPFMRLDEAVQLFDYELHQQVGEPGTVMTNAGDHTWGVEFDPAELVLKLPGARWADIVEVRAETQEQTFWGVREPETIGILTGNPCDSGLDLCSSVNKHIRELLGRNSLGDVSMAEIVFVSAPKIGISMEMDRRETQLRKALIHAVDKLCSTGAKILAHTTHYFAPDIAARAAEKEARFISMVDVTVTHLRLSNVKEVALLGTRYVTDFSLKWSVYKDAFEGIKVHVPSPAGWQKIHDLGYEIQQNGPTPICFNWMRDLLRDEVPKDCKHVLLAMTEFSPIVNHLRMRGRQGKILIDPVDIYGEAVAREYLGLTLRKRQLKSMSIA
jgi:aspartate/glutamate racemase/prolyl-tRNA editing enzyme YbaK/EbsC (Cys-tRNA(Pro) deacylase)